MQRSKSHSLIIKSDLKSPFQLPKIRVPIVNNPAFKKATTAQKATTQSG